MIRIGQEDARTGHGCSALQHAFRTQWSREGMRDIANLTKQRKLVTIAVGARARKVCGANGNIRYAVDPIDLAHPFVPHGNTEVVIMANRIGEPKLERRAKAEQVGFFHRPYTEDGIPCVGGKQCFKMVNYSTMPILPYQPALKCVMSTPAKARWAGKLTIRRIGDWVDFCVGKISNTFAANLPAAMYRVNIYDLLAGRAECDYDLPEPGQVAEYDEDINTNDVLIRFNGNCDLFSALTNSEGLPYVERSRGDILSADSIRYFTLLHKMSKVQNDITLLGKEYASSPLDWMWNACYAFDDTTARNIATLPGFIPTQQLKNRFLEALGPHGDFYLISKVSGVIKDVSYSSSGTMKLLLEDGQSQCVPECSILHTVESGIDVPIEPGVEINEGDIIGSYLSRNTRTWDQAVEELGESFTWILSDFINHVAIHPGEEGWEGSDVLIEHSLVSSVIQYTVQAADGPAWYWDLRNVRKYFDAETNFFIPPPIRHEDWSIVDLNLNGIHYHFGLTKQEFVKAFVERTNSSTQLVAA